MYGPLQNLVHKKATPRAGFTLVEMLITITIIGILAAGVTAALQSARETAKAAKTKVTITKLHYIIMARYDSYRTRRVPVDIRQYVIANAGGGGCYNGWDYSPAYAHARLTALRDLMRMEMPDRWSDVTDGPLIAINQPAVSLRYARLLSDAGGASDLKVATHAAAECLYMIVMSIPEAAEQFQNTEIGDVDGDGLKEFVDGWGRPIRFIRWPVGFVEHDSLLALNPTVGGPTGPAGQESCDPLEWSSPSDLQSGDRQVEPDPFDPTHVGFLNRSLYPQQGAGYKIFPLVYSAGADGIYDINIGRVGTATYAYVIPPGTGLLDPYLPIVRATADNAGNTLVYIGQPLDGNAIDGSAPNNALDHYDNIHNHILEVR